MNKTTIAWTEFTVNPIRFRNLQTHRVGHYCEKISPGCANCYASKMQEGPYLSGLRFTKSNFAKGDLYFDTRSLEQVIRRRTPSEIFWCDMTDLFGRWVPDEWIAACFGVMAATPLHRHQVLTKRPDRMCEFLRRPPNMQAATENLKVYQPKYYGLGSAWEWPMANVALGVSCENQAAANERIPLLLQTPAAIRFISAEPLLGPIEFDTFLGELPEDDDGAPFPGKIDGIIIGGESGPGARECQVDWIRSIQGQCEQARTACFLKQLGTKCFMDDHRGELEFRCVTLDRKGGNPDEWPAELRSERKLPWRPRQD